MRNMRRFLKSTERTESMEGLIFIVVLVVIVFCAVSHSSTNNEGESNNTSQPSVPRHSQTSEQQGNDEFRIRVVVKNVETDDKKRVDVLDLQIRGTISAPRDNFPAVMKTLFFDMTAGSDSSKFIVCKDEDFCDKENKHVLGPQNDFTVPYKESILEEWTSVFSLPMACLVFPKRGRRKVRAFTIIARNADDFFDNGNTIVSAEFDFEVATKRIGYEEVDESRRQFEDSVLTIAKMEIKRFEKQGDEAISDVVHQWIKERCSEIYADGETRKMETRMRDYMNKIATSQDINQLCACIKENANELHELYFAVELFLDIAENCGSDFTIDDLGWIDRIAVKLELDKEVYNGYKHKKLGAWIEGQAKAKDNPQDGAEKILGIDPSWPKERKLDYLNELYSHWNPIMSHSDQEKRKHAEHMIVLIAQYRNTL